MKELSREVIDSLINKYVANFALVEDGGKFHFLLKVDAPGQLTGWSNTNDKVHQEWLLTETIEMEKKKGFFKKEIEQLFIFSNGKTAFLFPAYIFLPLLNFLMEKNPSGFSTEKILRTNGLRFSLPS